MEIWKDIKGYEGSYMVSNYGRVKSLEKNIKSHNCSRIQYRPERILKQYKSKWGYMRVYLTQNSIKKMFAVHRLVAMAFIDNPDNKPCVNHIDNNRNNNVVDNLEWCTYKENSQWAEIQGRRVFSEEWKQKISETRKKKPVIATDDIGNQIYFSTVRSVAIKGFDPKAVIKCCKGKQKTHKGYKWIYFIEADKESEVDE